MGVRHILEIELIRWPSDSRPNIGGITMTALTLMMSAFAKAARLCKSATVTATDANPAIGTNPISALAALSAP